MYFLLVSVQFIPRILAHQQIPNLFVRFHFVDQSIRKQQGQLIYYIWRLNIYALHDTKENRSQGYQVIYMESAQSNGARAPFGDQTNIKGAHTAPSCRSQDADGKKLKRQRGGPV